MAKTDHLHAQTALSPSKILLPSTEQEAGWTLQSVRTFWGMKYLLLLPRNERRFFFSFPARRVVTMLTELFWLMNLNSCSKLFDNLEFLNRWKFFEIVVRNKAPHELKRIFLQFAAFFKRYSVWKHSGIPTIEPISVAVKEGGGGDY